MARGIALRRTRWLAVLLGAGALIVATILVSPTVASATSTPNALKGTEWTATITQDGKSGTNAWAFYKPKFGKWWYLSGDEFQCGGQKCVFSYTVVHSRLKLLYSDTGSLDPVFTGTVNKSETKMHGSVTCPDEPNLCSGITWTAVPATKSG